MNDERIRLDADRASFLRYTAAVLLLIAATVALGLSGLQYRSETVIPFDEDSWQIGGATSDAVTLEDGVLVVRQFAGSNRAHRSASLPPYADFPRASLRVSARLDGEIDYVGPDADHPPILATWFTRPDGERHGISTWPLPHGAFSGSNWNLIRKWPMGVDGFVVALLLREANGRIALRELEIDIVLLSTPYKILVALQIVAWAVFGLVAARYVCRRLQGLAMLVPLALAATIGAFILFSGEVIDTVIRPIVALFHGTRGGVSLVATFKIGHGVAFAALTLSLIAARRQLDLSLQRIVMLVALLALASEASQLHLPARTARLGDLLIDLAGALFAIGLWLLACAYRRRRKLRAAR